VKKINSRSVAGIAASLFLAAFVIVILFAVNRKTSKYDIVVFGDSRMVGRGLTETIPEIIEKETGLRTVNAAFGGTTMAEAVGSATGEREPLYSMACLSKYALSGSFRQLVAAVNTDGIYYRELLPEMKETAERLYTVDLKAAEYIIIGQGVNDCLAEMPVDNPDDPYDVTSYGGALRQSVVNLKKVSPKAEIILVTPAKYHLTSGVTEDGSSASMDFGRLKDYADKCLEIGASFGLPIADLYYGLDIREDNASDYLIDGLHYTENGAEIAAKIVLAAIKRAEDKND